ncbi:DUF262 domain-containing protein [Pseudomonas putida]|uniref:DUF262 domain-containing protein n=1 Tax=Pseudomonas putida TaxID=303 RepID=UPI0018D7F384|nr:DUF262 domain-containing protein [Pseudomonas putida]MBH3472182.1 DUF262 domain-containing protein [Pseudomonas putida]
MTKNSSGLILSVEEKIAHVRTRSLDVSFNEILDMYENEELIISPEYQRLFRWSEGNQSRFIESLLLELPIPPIFVIERDDNVYELIDGLQRISSYLHFRGALRSESESRENFKLIDCDVVKELNGFSYDELPSALKIKLKRNFIRLEVIRKESDQRLRYYMFKRLNTGGENLSEQELRNCTIRLLSPEFNDFIIKLSNSAYYQTCIEPISIDKKNEKYDQELILRFFAFKNDIEHYSHDIGDFLTEYMEHVSDPDQPSTFDYQAEEARFNLIFTTLNNTLGANAFSPKNDNGNWIDRFQSLHFEAISLGLDKALAQISVEKPDEDKLSKVLNHIKENKDFKRLTTGGGKNYKKQLKERIDFVANRIVEGMLNA